LWVVSINTKGFYASKANNRDFHIPSLRTLVEYDGEQHYTPIKHFGGSKEFKVTKFRDNIKTKWAEDNGFKLIRIKYTKLREIDKILERSLLHA
jgi:very-short-patch-repair endonuclease